MFPLPNPYVCLECCRSFKRPGGLFRNHPCPLCGKPALVLHPNFKPPRASNSKQWDKVRYLVEHGFRFKPIWDPEAEKAVPYPKTLREAIAWVARWKDLDPSRGGPGVVETI